MPRIISAFALTALLTCLGGVLPAQQSPAYRHASLPPADRARDLLARMTPAEKFWQLYMIPGDLDDPAFDYSNGVFGLQVRRETAGNAARADAEGLNTIQRWFVERTRLGIPIIPFEEALHGLLRPGATAFPQAIGLAATWDTALMGAVADAIARETRSRGIRQVLSPVVNIANDVRWGRVEETFGEDPYLASAMARAFVPAFEQRGVITTPKHFVANVGDGGRDSYPIELGARHLEEVHFPPFRAALRAGARSVMTAYNSVDGQPATQNPWLLNQKLKGDWGFGGFVISDAAATGGATVLHMTEPNTTAAAEHALRAGLDVIFQSSWPQHRPYLDAFLSGAIPAPVIDSAVVRVLRAKFELGLFEEPFVDPDSAAYWNGHASHLQLAREAARASLVLLRNGGVLPLRPGVRSIAVIGQDAIDARLGGYSGPGIAPVSILDGLRAAAGDSVQVGFAAGPGRKAEGAQVVPVAWLSHETDGRTTQGLRGEYWDNITFTGPVHTTRADDAIDFRWTISRPARGILSHWYSVRWTGRLTASEQTIRRIGVEGNDGFRLFVNGTLVVDNWTKRSYGTHWAELPVAPGDTAALRLEYYENKGNGRIRLLYEGEPHAWRARIDSAVSLARRSDVAIVVAGIEEGEFRDRAFLNLPGHQEELILEVADTGTPVVVVLVGGSAVTMSRWLDRVAAVALAWYPGEQGGHAVADVLLGRYNPAGRLPITFPQAEGQLPLVYNHKPTGRGDDYVDLSGLPLFPFGYGMSYTTFEYSDLRIEPGVAEPDGAVLVRCTVRNTGTRAGDEVVQLYLRDVLASVARPVMELKGFARIRLAPGQSREVTFRLTSADLEMLNAGMQPVIEPGTWRVMVGASSRDIRLMAEFSVAP